MKYINPLKYQNFQQKNFQAETKKMGSNSTPLSLLQFYCLPLFLLLGNHGYYTYDYTYDTNQQSNQLIILLRPTT